MLNGVAHAAAIPMQSKFSKAGSAVTTTPVMLDSEIESMKRQLAQMQEQQKVNELLAEYEKYAPLIESDTPSVLRESAESGKIQLPDILIGKSVGAKAKNYTIMDLETGEIFQFAEGTRIQNTEVFAGKGSKSEYRNAYKYADKYGGKAEDWQHVKGIGQLSAFDGDRKAEVHWSQCEGIGKHDFFIKRWLDE